MFTYQFKLLPSKETQSLLWKHANRLNWLYNRFLNERIESYSARKVDNSVKLITSYDQSKQLPILKSQKEFEDLKGIHSQVLQAVIKRLDIAYKAFFNKCKKKSTPGFPKFRSCKDFFGLLYPQNGYKIKDNFFVTKNYGKIKFNKSREILGKIKQIYISNKNNVFYINIATDHSYTTTERNSSVLAIDLGLNNLVVGKDNNGKIITIKNVGHAKHYRKKISKLQSIKDKLPSQKTDGKIKRSRKHKKLSQKIQRLYELKNRKINDFQHKVSHRLSHQYDTIIVEDLSVKKMSESNITGLNRNIRDAKLGQFLTFLGYKTHSLITVNPCNTSKTCNRCGYINKNLKLSDRQIKCPVCGHEYDRDENAAENIYCLGQAILDCHDQGSVTRMTINDLIPVEASY